MAKMKVVSYGNLSEYDELLKGYVGDEIDAAIESLDTASDVAIASKSGNAVTIAGSIAEADGIIGAGSATSVTLADVASTGAAEDVAYDNSISGLSADDVKDALDELAQASSGGVASKTIYVTDESAGQSDYAKVYKIYQGANAPDAATDPAVLKGTINIPKDKVLQASSIVDITYSEGHLYDGVTDVTTLIKGSGTATAADAGKYLKMEMQNVTDPLYVNLQIFVDVYTVASGATEVQLALNNHEFSASIVAVDGSKVIYKTETSAGAGDGETVKQALTRLDGADTTTGSVAKKIKDAVEALDTSADVVIASKSGDVVTLKAGISETDGIIAQGAGSDITLAAVASTGAASDVSYGTNSNVATAISDLETLVGDGVEECTTAEIQALFA